MLVGLACATAQSADLEFAQTLLAIKPAPGEKEIPFRFTFTNRSTRTITISEIRPDCGCTDATMSGKTYKPGEMGTIAVVYTIGTSSHGRQQKKIHVYTDNPDEKDIVLIVDVTLPEGPKIDHRVLTWDQGAPATTQVVTVIIPKDIPLRIADAADQEQRFLAQVQPTDDPKVVKVAITPRDTDRPVTNRVSIRFDSGYVLQVFARVRAKKSTEAPTQP
jgi:hypothetical protein